MALQLGPACRRLKVDDRVVIYHIKGCGNCRDCRDGYMISCQTKIHRAGGQPCLLMVLVGLLNPTI